MRGARRKDGAGMVLVSDALQKMANEGASVLLSYGEDTLQWECSWITGGKRYTGVNQEMAKAVLRCLEAAGVKVP